MASPLVKVTKDGLYLLQVPTVGSVNIKGYGTFGGGTFTIGFVDSTGTFQPYPDTKATNLGDFAWELACGSGENIAVDVTSSTSPDVTLEVREVP